MKLQHFVITAGLAALAGAAALAQDPDPAPDPENWRQVDPERLIVMDTTKGRILIETAPEFAPNHVARFTTLIRTGFYDGLTFHRVIDDFMIQGGDPQGTGAGGAGTNINAEFTVQRDESLPVVEVSDRGYNRGGFWHGMPVVTQPSAQLAVLEDATVESWITHCAGVMSTARSQAVNSADSQFFIMRYSERVDGASNTFLDRQYTAWGNTVGGLDVVRSMNVGTVRETPGFEPDRMERVRIAADMDDAERPQVWVLREDGAEFETLIDSARNEHGVAPDVCEIEIPKIVQQPS